MEKTTKRNRIPMNFKYIAKNLSRSAIKAFLKELNDELYRRDAFNDIDFQSDESGGRNVRKYEEDDSGDINYNHF